LGYWIYDEEVIALTTSQIKWLLAGDCLQTGKPSWYTTDTKINSAFHLPG